MKIRNLLPYAFALILLLWIVFILSREGRTLELIYALKPMDGLISILIALVLFSINGSQIRFLVRRASGLSMPWEDSLILPASMNLWSYILPFRGGLFYSMFYIRSRYRVELTQGFSIGLFTFLLSTSLAGFLGLYLSLNSLEFRWSWVITSLFLILSPILASQAIRISAFLMKRDIGKLGGPIRAFHRTMENFNAHLRDGRSTSFILLTIVLSIVIYIYWVYWAVRAFDIDMSTTSVILLAIMLRLSVIARFIPGNIGVQELISGAAVEFAGGNVSEGILVALFIRLSALLPALIMGIYSFLANIEAFRSISVKELWTKFRDF